MVTVQQTLAGVLIAIGAILSLLNWAALFCSLRTGRFVSGVPLVGGVCLGTGAFLLPVLRPYAGVAVLLDLGTVALLLSIPSIIRQEWATCRVNLLEEYIGQRGITTVSLRLFRRGHFTLRWEINRPPGESGTVGMGNVGTWEREADTLVLRIGENRSVFRPLPEGGYKGWLESAGFERCDQNPDLSLRGLEFVLNAGQRRDPDDLRRRGLSGADRKDQRSETPG
jgi:hypothetical protein